MAAKIRSAFALALAILGILQFVGFASTASLYDPDDPLWELDAFNFNRIVFGKNHAWFIEFYNSWCGHCIRFVPTWKFFARDTENWKKVIDIGVVNCVEPENVKLCRHYGVEGYPTLKLYGTQLNESDKGEPLNGSRDLESLRRAAINFIEEQKFTPTHWPILKPVNASKLSKLWKELPSNVNTAYIVVENSDSLIGREVILDLSAKENILMRRVTTTNVELTQELVGDIQNSSGPVFLKLHKNGEKETLHQFDDRSNDTFIRDLIFESIVGEQRVKDDGKVTPDEPTEHKENLNKGVYMADLENAVRYSLRQEVGVHADISGPKLPALKAYITALRTYFPGRPPVMAYLTKLHNWIINRKANLTGERFVIALDDLQTDKEYLPEMQDWVGCKGSTPKYRGYPCSLWTLFHTLTVQAYDQYEDSPNYNKEPQKILFTIRGYVKYFFTCEDCRNHFLEMAENMEKEIKGPKDTVLWFWQAHNQANQRLAGDATEDPSHPKIQFPSVDSCRQCRISANNDTDIEWDTNAVLRYLQYFYKKERIQSRGKSEDSEADRQQRKIIGNGHSHEEPTVINNSSISEHWNFRWFTNADVSLCVSLYFVSALLLVVIYLFFTQRRRRRKSRYKKLISVYP